MEDRTLLQNIQQPPKLSTPALIISKLVVMVLPIAQIALGGLYLQECPVQKYIPVFLVVLGVFSLTLSLLSCLPCGQEPQDGSTNLLSSVFTAWNSLVSLFLFCWFIAGNVWIYSIYPPSYDPSSPQYCNKTLYQFAFWIVTLMYILLGALLVGGCCVLVCMCLCRKTNMMGGADDV